MHLVNGNHVWGELSIVNHCSTESDMSSGVVHSTTIGMEEWSTLCAYATTIGIPFGRRLDRSTV